MMIILASNTEHRGVIIFIGTFSSVSSVSNNFETERTRCNLQCRCCCTELSIQNERGFRMLLIGKNSNLFDSFSTRSVYQSTLEKLPYNVRISYTRSLWLHSG